jgi:uncharacterized membrane protein (DUF2068 family)
VPCARRKTGAIVTSSDIPGGSKVSGLRAVALLEAAKGSLVLAAGGGLLALAHHDIQRFAEQLVEQFHLNPASRYPRIFIEAATQLTDARLWLLAALAAGYATVRFIEAYGLWRQRPWAEWFAAISGGIYVPIELYELLHGVTWAKTCVLVVNAGVVAYMIYALRQSKSNDRGRAAF